MEKVRRVTDKEGNKIAMIVPIKTWEILLEELEMAEDVKAYDEAKGKKNPVYYPWEEVKKELFG